MKRELDLFKHQKDKSKLLTYFQILQLKWIPRTQHIVNNIPVVLFYGTIIWHSRGENDPVAP